jgi:hypothetical protein
MPFNERFTGTVVINDTQTNDYQTWSSQKISTTGGGGGFTFRGAYSATTLYAVNNVVSYLGSSWIRTALNGTAVGDAPAVGSAYWGVFASAGAQGEPGLSTSLFEYRIDRNAIVLAGLAPGDIRANNADLTAATLLWVSHLDDLGNDVERFIALLKSGSQLIIQDKSNNDNFIIYNVLTGVSQVNNSHVAIPVASSSGNGLANLTNNKQVFLALQYTTNPSIVISPTITGAPGTSAEVVNIGTGVNANLVFTIPQGLTGATGATGPQGPPGSSGVGVNSIYRFRRNVDSTASGFFNDGHLVIGWTVSSNELTVRNAITKTGVYAILLSNNGGSFPQSSSTVLLSDSNRDYYFNSGVGQIAFTVQSDNDLTAPFYKVRLVLTGSGGTAVLYAIVQKFT